MVAESQPEESEALQHLQELAADVERAAAETQRLLEDTEQSCRDLMSFFDFDVGGSMEAGLEQEVKLRETLRVFIVQVYHAWQDLERHKEAQRRAQQRQAQRRPAGRGRGGAEAAPAAPPGGRPELEAARGGGAPELLPPLPPPASAPEDLGAAAAEGAEGALEEEQELGSEGEGDWS